MGDVLPDGTIGGYEGYCPKCHEVVKMNMQGNILDGHKCKSDNNTSIPKEIMDKIEKEKLGWFDKHCFKSAAIWMYQLRQQEVDELKLKHTNEYIQVMNDWKKERNELQSQLKAANENWKEAERDFKDATDGIARLQEMLIKANDKINLLEQQLEIYRGKIKQQNKT